VLPSSSVAKQPEPFATTLTDGTAYGPKTGVLSESRAASKSPVVAAHSWEAFLQTVHFPDLSRSSNQVAGEGHPTSSYLDQIGDGAIGMAWGIDNLESQTLPFVNITCLQCALNIPPLPTVTYPNWIPEEPSSRNSATVAILEEPAQTQQTAPISV
jgi:hypothetical protein